MLERCNALFGGGTFIAQETVPFRILVCATIRAECVRHGGNTWHRIDTPHFRVHTEQPLEEGHAYAQLLYRTPSPE